MKICWDNLEKLRYNLKTGKWYKGKSGYIYMDSCKKCNNPFLTTISNLGDFCSKFCASSGDNNPSYKHGYSKRKKVSSTYSTWYSMKQRCLNPNNLKFEYYGAREITVCERWMKFENFFEDMGERPKGMTIDRID